MTTVTLAAEGACDIQALRKLAIMYGLKVGPTYDCRGKSKLDQRLDGFLQAAQFGPWIILRDLDHDFECAPTLVRGMQIAAPDLGCFRVAVRSIEAWLLADRKGASSWLRVKESAIPSDPELLANPKQRLVQLAASSTNRTIKAPMRATRRWSGRRRRVRRSHLRIHRRILERKASN